MKVQKEEDIKHIRFLALDMKMDLCYDLILLLNCKETARWFAEWKILRLMVFTRTHTYPVVATHRLVR